MTSDISKLKIVEGSKFFKVENGKILFNNYEEFLPINNLGDGKYGKYMRQLISAVGAGEWYEYLINIWDYEKMNDLRQKIREGQNQIKLWKGLADER